MSGAVSVLLEQLQGGERNLQLPAELSLQNGEHSVSLQLTQVLRLLPGKRVTLRGAITSGAAAGQSVAVKLFLREQRGERHQQREQNGCQRLQDAGIACPQVLFSGAGFGGQLLGLVYNWVDDSQGLGQCWPQFNREQKQRWLQRVLATVRQLHEHGAWQDDIHLDNFLVKEQTLVMLDLATVRLSHPSSPLSTEQSLANLGQLAAQLNVADHPLFMSEAQAYVEQRGWIWSEVQPQLQKALRRAWRARLSDYLDKSERECTLTRYQQRFGWRWACRRSWWGTDLEQFMLDPERLMAQGTLLKAGNTATVVKATINGRDVVVKRYNIKNWRHAISRALRPTRASHSWRYAHVLELIGIDATRPVALLEKRWGPVRGRAYFVCEAINAPDLLSVGQQRSLQDSEQDALAALLEQM